MFKPLRFLFAAIFLMAILFGLVWAITRPQNAARADFRPLLAERAVQKVLTAAGKVVRQGKAEVSLSADEVNALAEAYFEGAWWKKKDAGRKTQGPYTLERATVAIERSTMTLFFAFRYRGTPVYAQFQGVPTLEDNHLGFDASSMRLGAVPLPGFIANQILGRVLADPTYKKSLTMRDEIRAIRVKNGDVVLTLQR